MKALCLAAGAMFAFAGHAYADGDATKGKSVFRQCQSCHSVEEGANRVGPSLFRIVDRPAASVAGYTYSDALTAFGAAGHKWDEATLSAYLQAPRDYIPDIKMAFAGLKRPEDIANLIAYLKDPKAVKSGW
jgi:cytochrome c